MIAATATMKPLPVRPVEPVSIAAHATSPSTRRSLGGTMQPLPVPMPDSYDLVDAIRDAAFERMLDRIGVELPLPVVDPSI
jgi:hypothetical protein